MKRMMNTYINKIVLLCFGMLFSVHTEVLAQDETKEISTACMAYFENGNKALQQKDYQEMNLYIDSIYAHCPDSVYGMVFEALARTFSGQKEEAIQHLNDVIRYPEHEYVQSCGGVIEFHYRLAVLKAELGDSSKMDSLVKADHEIFFNWTLEKTKSNKKRLQKFKQYHERYPEHDKVLSYYISCFYYKEKDFQYAIAYATRALEAGGELSDHQYQSLFWVRGNSYFQDKEFEKSLSDLKEVVVYYEKETAESDNLIVQLPEQKELLLRICVVYRALEDLENVIAYATKALEVEGEYHYQEALFVFKGESYISLRELEKAVSTFEQFMKNEETPSTPTELGFNVRKNLAELYVFLADYKKANNIYKELIEKEYGDVSLQDNDLLYFYMVMAFNEMLLKDYIAAIDILDQGILTINERENIRSEMTLYLSRSCIHFLKGDTGQASRDLEKAIHLGEKANRRGLTTNHEAISKLIKIGQSLPEGRQEALLFEQMDEIYSIARHELERMPKDSPFEIFTPILSLQGYMLWQRGDNSQALQVLNKSISLYEDIGAYYVKALIYFDDGAYSLASHTVSKLVEFLEEKDLTYFPYDRYMWDNEVEGILYAIYHIGQEGDIAIPNLLKASASWEQLINKYKKGDQQVRQEISQEVISQSHQVFAELQNSMFLFRNIYTLVSMNASFGGE